MAAAENPRRSYLATAAASASATAVRDDAQVRTVDLARAESLRRDRQLAGLQHARGAHVCGRLPWSNPAVHPHPSGSGEGTVVYVGTSSVNLAHEGQGDELQAGLQAAHRGQGRGQVVMTDGSALLVDGGDEGADRCWTATSASRTELATMVERMFESTA